MSPIMVLLTSVTSCPMAPGNSCPNVYDESPRKDTTRLFVGKRHRTPSIKRNIPYRPRSTVSGVPRKMGSRPATNEHEDIECPLFLSPTAIKPLPIAFTSMARRYTQFWDTNNSGLSLEGLTLQTVTVSDTSWGIKSSYRNGRAVPCRLLAHGSVVCLHNLTWYGYCSI